MNRCGKFKEFLKYCDTNGEKIGLRYKNKEKHKSLIGGIVTICSVLSILAYFLVLFNGLL